MFFTRIADIAIILKKRTLKDFLNFYVNVKFERG